jgi:DNA processing protein
VPGSGINDTVLYPRTNRALARRILDAGGGLLSEFEPQFVATPWSFPQRNRIMVGLADAVLLIEANEKSGTLITARLTVDYNRELLVVPGNIFAENSRGAHQFLKLGATPVTTPEDILNALGIDVKIPDREASIPLSAPERTIIEALAEPCDHNALIRALNCPAEEVLMLLMQMELKGLIQERGGVFYKTR